MAAIAQILGCAVGTVYRDICWAREQWRTRAVDAIEKLRQIELGRVDHIEVEAWKAWKRSVGIHEVVTRKTGMKPGGDGGEIDETSEKRERLAGDPRFLDVAGRCVEQRRKILGLDAPTKSELSGPGGSPLVEGIRVEFVDPPKAS